MGDPLLDMAIQAGYFPAPAPAQERTDYQTFLSSQGQGVTAPSQVPSPVASGPVDSPSELGYPGAPGTAAPLAQPSTTVKEGTRVGTSSRGYSEAQMGKVSKADGGLQAQYAQADAKAAAGGKAEADIIKPAYDADRAASQSVAEATVDRIYAQGHAANLQRALADSFAQDEMKMNMEAQAMSDQAKADYVAALADMRATKINPAQWWSNQTPGMKFGTLVTAFVHDFLGAKGIKTSAMDTMNMAIERNINAQVQALKTKGEVAEGFKSLWWMQRNQSASDAEARQRVRGFLLEGVKQQVISNMAQYEAGLATAQGQAAIAAIDKELANTLVNIHRHIDQNALALRNQALELHKAKLMASVQSQSNNIALERLRMEKDQLKAKARADYIGRLVPDTTASGGGRARWIFRQGSGITPDKQGEVLDRLGALTRFSDQAQRFQDLARKVGTLPQNWWKNAQTEEQRQLVQLRDDMAYQLAYADSGKALNQAEVETKKAQFNLDVMFQRGDTAKQIAQSVESQYKAAFAKMAPYVSELKEGDVGYNEVISPALASNTEIPSAIPGNAEALENWMIARGKDKEKTMDQRALEEFTGLVRSPQGQEPEISDPENPSAGPNPHIKDEFKLFEAQYPDQAKRAKITAWGNYTENNPAAVRKMNSPDEYIPRSVANIIRLGDMVEAGGEQAANARKILQHEADAWLRGGPGSEQDYIGALAALQLAQAQGASRPAEQPNTSTGTLPVRRPGDLP